MPLQAKAISMDPMAMALACEQRNFFKAAAQMRGCPGQKLDLDYSPV